MTTRSGARIYRRQPRPLARGACPHCTRIISVNRRSLRRREHAALDGSRCIGSGMPVGAQTVILDDLPPVVLPRPRSGTRGKRAKPYDPRVCVDCGQSPRLKKDGSMAAHRVDVDDPVSPYCPGGSRRSY